MPARTSSARASAAANGNRAAMDCGPATAYCSPPHQVVRSVLKSRCRWSAAAPEFPVYHDTEWGFPVSNDFRLFEKLSLEGFQSGLSWRTILAKRANFRDAFHDFDFNRIARFMQRDI